jgi:hypothetical protein
MPVNVCSHCAESDDPQDTRHWPEDEDGDRICPACAEADSGRPQYCPIDGFGLDEDGDCDRCQREAAAEQAEEDARDMEYED